MTRAEAATWMDTIHDDIRDAYLQDVLFWQFQDMIRQNERLANSQNVFLYWVNMLFKDSIVMAVRRQIDRDNKSISLRRLLTKLQADPGIAGNRLTAADIQTDIDDLDRTAHLIRAFADRRITHADRRDLGADHPTFGDVRKCLEQVCALANKYAGSLCEPALTLLPPASARGWQEIFTFRWLDQGHP